MYSTLGLFLIFLLVVLKIFILFSFPKIYSNDNIRDVWQLWESKIDFSFDRLILFTLFKIDFELFSIKTAVLLSFDLIFPTLVINKALFWFEHFSFLIFYSLLNSIFLLFQIFPLVFLFVSAILSLIFLELLL